MNIAPLSLSSLNFVGREYAAPANILVEVQPLRIYTGGAVEKTKMDIKEALKKAVGGGIPGAIAMVLQVLLLMWLRTTVNVQMKTGETMLATMSRLYGEGGIPRFYQGMWAALLQGPLSRFGDTAANAGMLAFLSDTQVPVAVKTVLASAAASLFRIGITPIDTVKTLLQVEGGGAFKVLSARLSSDGVFTLWAGATGTVAATFVGHYPWFFTNNALEEALPAFGISKSAKLSRRALIGFCSSFVSDCLSNSLRVLKTYTQTSATPVGYIEAAKIIIEQDGIGGLMWRGLVAKVLCNGVSSIIFSILWKMLMDRNAAKEKQEKSKSADPSTKNA
mmetsp:Transcript_67607/g.152991  ORF Transcript_67607/g.152991 Transcript_67607/m.152991 type:complete len:334 (+) Transcript_67607:111-1112(+)